MPLPAKGHREYTDASTHGLILRISGSGRRSFYGHVRANGRAYRVKLGQWSDHDDRCLEEARYEIAKLRTRATNGFSPKDTPIRTVGDLAAVYLKKKVPQLKQARAPKVFEQICDTSRTEGRPMERRARHLAGDVRAGI